MAAEFSIKINRRDGALEINGPEQEWVDRKLIELRDVYTGQLPSVSEAVTHSEPPVTQQTRRKGPARPTNMTKSGAADVSAEKANRPRRSGGRPQRNPELESKLTREVVERFMNYVAERQQSWDKKQTHQAAIIATFLEEELGWPGVNEDDLYTIFRLSGLEGPTNYRSMLQNAYGRDKFFVGAEDGKYKLSVAGEKFGRRTAEPT